MTTQETSSEYCNGLKMLTLQTGLIRLGLPELLEKGKGANVFIHLNSELWSLQGSMQK
jgi:hypothetical protein